MGDAGEGGAEEWAVAPPLPPTSIKTHGVDILGGEKRWLLPEAGEDEGREHQGKVDIEGGEAEGV